jgi:cytochrome c556
MMMRLLLTAAVLAIGVSGVSAQQDPVAARKAIMKKNGDEAKVGAAMVKGETPFDLAKAKTIFATFASASDKAKNLFPDTAKTGEKSTASPKIWENKSDFDARLAKLGKDAKAAGASVTDLASFKTAFASVGKDCGGCHKEYRIKKD